jgi:hypothetical protein
MTRREAAAAECQLLEIRATQKNTQESWGYLQRRG